MGFRLILKVVNHDPCEAYLSKPNLLRRRVWRFHSLQSPFLLCIYHNQSRSLRSNPPPLASNESFGKSFVDLLLKSSEEDLKQWPHSFKFHLRVSLAIDGDLTLVSRVRNISGKPFSFSFVLCSDPVGKRERITTRSLFKTWVDHIVKSLHFFKTEKSQL
ncbi:hypothetical protein IGI04_019311 [Brassica rapa subsp. trilocularis]|uniref:Uncharacterized protein n=1 Tax=Brassica rapa subsp. trilocularis TaxID=1813537 RepID=A0ABQ7MFV0_BRACM|nr:hypothetical protein IGI04_019311 [Brassica rapa subsp. trilocularis]